MSLSTPQSDAPIADAGRVYGLDNVAIDLPIAGVGPRVLAGFLDYLLVGIAVFAWLVGGAFLAGVLGGVLGGTGGAKTFFIVLALALLGMFLIEYGYFAGFEIATGGQTLGKRVVGLVVVTFRGARPTWGVLLARNLVRSIDLLVGVPLMALDAQSRRLGDRIAGTLVVYAQRSAAEGQRALWRVPRGWSAADVALLESFLARADELDAPRAEAIARKLLAAIRRDDPALLEQVAESSDPVAMLRAATLADKE